MEDVGTAASEGATSQRDLAALFSPRSVAVVGAANDRSKWGGDLTARLLRAPAGRRILLVNKKGRYRVSLLTRRCVSSSLPWISYSLRSRRAAGAADAAASASHGGRLLVGA
jgi:hypothetical protein